MKGFRLMTTVWQSDGEERSLLPLQDGAALLNNVLVVFLSAP